MNDPSPSLRSVRPSDAADLHRNCFPEQSLDAVQDYLHWCLSQMRKGRMVRLVAEVNGQVVANGQLAIHRHDGEIGSLVVSPAYHRRGIGTALVGALVAEARNCRVRTLEIAAPSGQPWIQAWYQRLGFAFHRERTYPGDERVAILRVSLCPPSRPYT